MRRPNLAEARSSRSDNAFNASLSHPRLWPLYVFDTLAAGVYTFNRPAVSTWPARLLPVELLPSSIALYTLIRDGRTYQIPSLQQRGRALGVVRLDESLADLVRAQKATLEVVKQFAESPPDLEALVARGNPSISPRKA